MIGFKILIVAVTIARTIASPEVQTRTVRECLSPAEAREAVARGGLALPAAAQRQAMAHVQAEPLRNRLCRWNNDLVYEITLLRLDGKLAHVFVAARNGLIVKSIDD